MYLSCQQQLKVGTSAKPESNGASDQNLVSKSADQVEAEVHERPGAGGATVLLHPRHPRTQAHVHRGQALVSGQKIFKVQKISMTT